MGYAPYTPGQSQPGSSSAPTFQDFSSDPANNFAFYLHRQPPAPSNQFLRNAGVEPGDLQPATPDVFGSFITQFVRFSRDAIIAYQKRLEAAGLLKKGEYLQGDGTDPNTLAALQKAATSASAAGVSLDEKLDEMGSLYAKQLAEGETDHEADLRQRAEDALNQDFYSKYVDLWGSIPPAGLVEKSISSGMNLYQFEYQQRQDPAFSLSPTYQRERLSLESSLAERLGTLGLGGIG